MSRNNSHNVSVLAPSLHNEDEAVAIENAIRTAVNTVMTVIYNACSRRVSEYQEMVADRDKEIRRLECKLEKSEHELNILRLQLNRRPEDQLSSPGSYNAGEVASNDVFSGSEDNTDNEPAPETCGGGAGPSQFSPAGAFPHQHSRKQTNSREGEQAAGIRTPVVKEEPSDLEIKLEVCEGSSQDQQGGQQGAESQHKEEASVKGTPPEPEAEMKNCPVNKSISTQDEDEHIAHLKRKGGGGKSFHPAESEEEEVVVKKHRVAQPCAPRLTTLKGSLAESVSQQLSRLSSDGSLTANLNTPDPFACQPQTYCTMSAPQPTCDPILLEVLVSLETIKQQNTTVLQILQSGNSSGPPVVCEPPDVGMLALPLQSVQDLRSLEQRLSMEPELKKKMISYLRLTGGMTTKESVWRIMAKLFTNTLAKNINWRGTNNKQKIENLTIKRVIVDAVRQNSFCKDAVDEEIERYIKRWLQLAGDRDGGRKRRQEKGKEAHSISSYCMDDMFAHVIH